MVLFKKRIAKALIRLRECAGWSVPVLFANTRRQVFSRRGPYGNLKIVGHVGTMLCLNFLPTAYFFTFFFVIVVCLFFFTINSFEKFISQILSECQAVGTRSGPTFVGPDLVLNCLRRHQQTKSQSTIFQSERGRDKRRMGLIKKPQPHLNMPQVKQISSCEI